MDLLKEIEDKIIEVENDRNMQLYDVWNDEENLSEAYRKAEKIISKYKNRLYTLDMLKARLESVIADFEYYKTKK